MCMHWCQSGNLTHMLLRSLLPIPGCRCHSPPASQVKLPTLLSAKWKETVCFGRRLNSFQFASSGTWPAISQGLKVGTLNLRPGVQVLKKEVIWPFLDQVSSGLVLLVQPYAVSSSSGLMVRTAFGQSNDWD